MRYSRRPLEENLFVSCALSLTYSGDSTLLLMESAVTFKYTSAMPLSIMLCLFPFVGAIIFLRIWSTLFTLLFCFHIESICPLILQILGTGMDTQDTSPAVLLFFDKQRFIFNAGEVSLFDFN